MHSQALTSFNHWNELVNGASPLVKYDFADFAYFTVNCDRTICFLQGDDGNISKMMVDPF